MWTVDVEIIVPWLDMQDEQTVANILTALEQLEQYGPTLGRPFVDTLKGTEVKNLKELRPASPGKTEVRILFAFDPTRKAILLLGGDKPKGKSGRIKWSGWYKDAISRAEEIYRQYLRRLGDKNDHR